jgi:hypothetical protein
VEVVIHHPFGDFESAQIRSLHFLSHNKYMHAYAVIRHIIIAPARKDGSQGAGCQAFGYGLWCHAKRYLLSV